MLYPLPVALDRCSLLIDQWGYLKPLAWLRPQGPLSGWCGVPRGTFVANSLRWSGQGLVLQWHITLTTPSWRTYWCYSVLFTFSRNYRLREPLLGLRGASESLEWCSTNWAPTTTMKTPEHSHTCTKPSIYARQVCTLHVITLPTAVHTWRGCAKYLHTHAEYPLLFQ